MSYTVCFFFCILAEAIIIWLYSSSVFYAKKSPQIRICVLSIFYFILFLVSLTESKWLNVVSYLLLNFVFFYYMFQIRWIFAVFHSILITALMSTCEVVTYGIIKLSSPHFLEHGSDPSAMAMFGVLNKFIFLIVVYILSRFMIRYQKSKEQNNTSILLLVFIPLTSVFITLTITSISESYQLSSSLNNMLILSTVLMLISNLLIFIINQHDQLKHEEFTDLQLSLQKESSLASYYEMLSARDEDQRILIHDIKKHLNSVSILYSSGQQQKAESYIQELLQSPTLNTAPVVCDNNLLNSIIYKFKADSDQYNIDFKVDIRKNTLDYISDKDLTTIFCNLLENAVESAQKCSEPFIDLSVSLKDETDITVITLVNSCATNPISKKGVLPTSSKANAYRHHGFGLKSIKKAIETYQGDIQMYYVDNTASLHTIITTRER